MASNLRLDLEAVPAAIGDVRVDPMTEAEFDCFIALSAADVRPRARAGGGVSRAGGPHRT